MQSGAQCYPRLACTLKGLLLMQVHEHAESAPALAALTIGRQEKSMQIDASSTRSNQILIILEKDVGTFLTVRAPRY